MQTCSTPYVPRKRIIVLGDGVAAQPGLASVLGQFDWTAEMATDLDGLVKLGSRRDVVAAMVQPQAIDLPWKQTLAAVRQAAPDAAVILCHRFSDAIDWAEASAEGAFSLLHLPLDLGELRQSLGFVWAARNKRFHVIPADAAERSRLRKSAGARSRTSTQVA